MDIHDWWLRLSTLSPFRYTATKCGHRTKRAGSISAFDENIVTKIPLNSGGSVDYCLDCLGKMAIPCAWCNKPIFIGDPVTLYTSRDGSPVPEQAVIFNKEPLQLVGCLRFYCADTGADRAGFWVPGEDGKGTVYNVPTVYEMMLGAPEPSMVIVEDLGDINEALNPHLIPLKDQEEK